MVRRAAIIGTLLAASAAGVYTATRPTGPLIACETRGPNGEAIKLEAHSADECMKAADKASKGRP